MRTGKLQKKMDPGGIGSLASILIMLGGVVLLHSPIVFVIGLIFFLLLLIGKTRSKQEWFIVYVSLLALLALLLSNRALPGTILSYGTVTIIGTLPVTLVAYFWPNKPWSKPKSTNRQRIANHQSKVELARRKIKEKHLTELIDEIKLESEKTKEKS
jgi:predicted membrane protein